jgi:hypothetical protein
MLYLNNDYDVYKNAVSITQMTSNQAVVKVRNPVFKIHEEYRVPWQVQLENTIYRDEYDYDSVAIVPLIPQYFHNFYEIFPKLILLKSLKENFSVIIVRPEQKEDEVFYSLIRNKEGAQCNAVHMIDFLKYAKINFICLTPDELMLKKIKHTYLFYDTGKYKDTDPKLNFNNKEYTVAYFLKVPYPEIIIENSHIVKSIFPSYDLKENKKIFISRKKGHHRPYKFENELEDAMIKLGYRSILMEDLSLPEQIRIMQESERIIVPYGSGLVNGIFSNNSKILSINYTKDYYVDTYDYTFKEHNITYDNVNIFEDNIEAIDKAIQYVVDWEKK